MTNIQMKENAFLPLKEKFVVFEEGIGQLRRKLDSVLYFFMDRLSFIIILCIHGITTWGMSVRRGVGVGVQHYSPKSLD